jgi:hypothetical protein
MGGSGRFVRRYGLELIVTCAILALAWRWLRPPPHVDGDGLSRARPGDIVEVTFERFEPIPYPLYGMPWTMGWLDGRTVVVRTGDGAPRELTVRGKLHALDDTDAHARGLASVRALDRVYPWVLDLREAGHGLSTSMRVLCVVVFLFWVWAYRVYRWEWVERRPSLSSALEGARPRSDATVAAVLRRYAVLPYVMWLTVLVVIAMPIAAALVDETVLGFARWADDDLPSPLGRFAIDCAVGAALWAVPFALWVVRRRRQLARVVRDGEIVVGRIGIADTKRGGIEVFVALAHGAVRYRLRVPHRPSAAVPVWALPGEPIRVLAAGDAAFAILLAPTGEEQVVDRIGPRRRARSRLPRARLVTARSCSPTSDRR